MVKINDTTAFPNTVPSVEDHVIGTDISNTTNSADGETVTFTIGSISGSTKLLTSADASNDSTLDFTAFDSTLYDSYLFTLSNVIPATDSTFFIMRTSTDGGSTFDSSGTDYAYSFTNVNGSTTVVGTFSDNSGFINLTSSIGSDTGEGGVSGQVWVNGPHLTKSTIINWNLGYVYSTGSTGMSTGSGSRKAEADVDAVRFYFSTGNIESGTITMYGIRNQ